MKKILLALCVLGGAGYAAWRCGLIPKAPGGGTEAPAAGASNAGPAAPGGDNAPPVPGGGLTPPPVPAGKPGKDLYAEGKYAEAVGALQRELTAKMVADVPCHYGMIAYAHEAMKQPDAALPWWNRILAEFPETVYCADAECALGRRAAAGSEVRRGHFTRALARSPDSAAVKMIAGELADMLDKAGQKFEARQAYTIAWEQMPPADPRRTAIESRLNALNQSLVFSSEPTPDSTFYVIQPGDSLAIIASKTNCPIGYMRRANRIKGDNIVAGNKLKVLQGTWTGRVELSQCRMTLFLNGHFIRRYVVGIGKPETPTPPGTYTVSEKLTDPDWKGIPSADPRNILGTRWLSFFEDPTYGIHGTALSADSTVGTPSSNGCVRMHNADVEEVYDLIPKGTKIAVVP
ncbi:MAG: L,D-transpeptidase family protein [Planctomycetes bacterium]|nr:L,D-transpeptidase family protein [Planctomycetota bacterium]